MKVYILVESYGDPGDKDYKEMAMTTCLSEQEAKELVKSCTGPYREAQYRVGTLKKIRSKRALTDNEKADLKSSQKICNVLKHVKYRIEEHEI